MMGVTTRQRIIAALPVLVASCAIYVASSIPSLRPPNLGFNWQDKLFHAIAYFAYAACVHLFVVRTLHLRSPMIVGGLVILTGLAFAASDEWHQTFVEGRVGEIADWLADTTGVLLYVITVIWLRNSRTVHRDAV